LWKGLIYYYYLHHSRKGGFATKDKSKQEQQKYISGIAKSCELTLRDVTEIDLIMIAKYLLLKLSLLMQKERFGCDLSY
jgi:hypothetical protein